MDISPVSSPAKFKVGDYLVDFGQVFRIIKIDTSPLGQLLVFVPHFSPDGQAQVTSSIPIANLDKTTIRLPLDKKTLNQVLLLLSDKKIKNDLQVIDVLTAKSVLNQNDPQEIAKTIRKIYLEKSKSDGKFTGSKNYIYQLLIDRLSEETALVFNLSLDKAQAKITNLLKKH